MCVSGDRELGDDVRGGVKISMLGFEKFSPRRP